MLLKFTATGETLHVENAHARAFLAAGLAEEIKIEKPKPDLTPRWAVDILNRQGENPTLAVVMQVGQNHTHFTGKPEDVNKAVRWDGGQRFLSGFGRECPEAICRQYAEAWEANLELRGDFIANGRVLRD
jgi:hypothetical protein